MIDYILLILLTFFGALGSFFFKKSLNLNNPLIVTIKNENFIIGCFSYIISIALNIIVLQMMPYTIVLPVSSMTYIWSYFFGISYLKEKNNNLKISGIILIVIGVLIISVN